MRTASSACLRPGLRGFLEVAFFFKNDYLLADGTNSHDIAKNPLSGKFRGLSGCGQPLRATHTGSIDTAIAAGIFREVLLMVVLGVIEVSERLDFGGD